MSENLKNLLEEKIAAYNRFAEDEAFDNMKYDEELYSKQALQQKELGETMNSAVKTLLNEDAASLEFNDEFYKAARECLTMKPYVLFDGIKIAEDVTEKELEPFAAQIAAGDFSSLGDLVEKDTRFISNCYAVFNNFRAIIANFRFFTLTLAHRAKHFGSFAAGEKFLRATSIIGRFERKFAEIEEEDVDQMLEYLEDGLEDIAIAADYHKMQSWEEYLKEAKSRIIE